MALCILIPNLSSKKDAKDLAGPVILLWGTSTPRTSMAKHELPPPTIAKKDNTLPGGSKAQAQEEIDYDSVVAIHPGEGGVIFQVSSLGSS